MIVDFRVVFSRGGWISCSLENNVTGYKLTAQHSIVYYTYRNRCRLTKIAQDGGDGDDDDYRNDDDDIALRYFQAVNDDTRYRRTSVLMSVLSIPIAQWRINGNSYSPLRLIILLPNEFP